ncbi:hypothetical protein GDO81_006196 [Engystomops pustulosus]|uniref:Uncharacterized protein n=1 Tax=Engystomops pustulosus TaxID=76066 RepID=A0AAV7CWC9_ENGPU|nr:hypothetical protein GDO81_006196 [Engystomops pustulosus]
MHLCLKCYMHTMYNISNIHQLLKLLNIKDVMNVSAFNMHIIGAFCLAFFLFYPVVLKDLSFNFLYTVIFHLHYINITYV